MQTMHIQKANLYRHGITTQETNILTAVKVKNATTSYIFLH